MITTTTTAHSSISNIRTCLHSHDHIIIYNIKNTVLTVIDRDRRPTSGARTAHWKTNDGHLQLTAVGHLGANAQQVFHANQPLKVVVDEGKRFPVLRVDKVEEGGAQLAAIRVKVDGVRQWILLLSMG